MEHIVTAQGVVTASDDWTPFADFGGPTDAELDAIERELPLIQADIDLLDAQIIALDRPVNEVDQTRIRRARRRVLTVRRELANYAELDGGAA
ncbi:hypothetical protein SAMN05216489_03800 [Streptomyces sp. 3213]|uniref:DUF6284 family protein n=1 Tax=Streptomyces sp. 3213.3 TaxID=1855348 RepID=UPI0008953EF2|nr:DUF6284 family protein [Streptomyces sp. 3213.3]SED56811.1 hypothetical protein SAMN05216489_03800 [Streptomyces sp. 3213] [Streptomyces sp. 3213.3]